MLTRRVIPCLDVDAGRVVKGVRFQGLADAGDPVALARRYEAAGADELCLLDVSATHEGRANAVATVARVRDVLGIPLTVGGGVRSLADARALLAAGADKVAVNSAALARPQLVAEIAEALGAQCCVIAIDAARRVEALGPRSAGPAGPAEAAGPRSNAGAPSRAPDPYEVVTHGGRVRTGVSVVAWAREATGLGAGEVLLTSLDRDGTGSGYDLALLAAVRAATDAPLVASGGVGAPADAARHCLAAFEAGAHAVLAASVFHLAGLAPRDLKAALGALGVEVRP